MIYSLGSKFLYHAFLFRLHVLLSGTSCNMEKNHLYAASTCGNVRNVSYLFRLKCDKKGCGHSEFELACENDHTILYLYAGQYYMTSIHCHYNDTGDIKGYLMVVDDGLQMGNYSSLPRYPLALSNFSINHLYYPSIRNLVVFVKCSQPVASILFVETTPCIEGAYTNDTPPNLSQVKVYSYALHGSSSVDKFRFVGPLDIENSCTITMMSFASDYIWVYEEDQDYYVSLLPYKSLHNLMAEGFNLSYYKLNPPYGASQLCFVGFTCRRQRCSYYKSSKRLSQKLFFLSFSSSSFS